jgi:hypothetical protein
LTFGKETMITFIILVTIIAWTLSAGLKRYERGRRFSGWRVWLASMLGLSICYFAARADAIGIPLSLLLSPLLQDRLGFMTLSLCFLLIFFGVQMAVNHAVLRDSNGARVQVSVNTRLCARSILSLLAIPLAIVTLHAVALVLIFAA